MEDGGALDSPPECVEHIWGLVELVFSLRGTLETWRCERCGAESAHKPAGSR